MTAAAVDVFPDPDWPTADPEAQGVDSRELDSLFRSFQNYPRRIDSLLIIRGGYLITEAYFGPYRPIDRHGLASATKSVTSLLIGIAVRQGLLAGVDQPVLGLFPDLRPANPDPRKDRLQVRHLLNMTAGLQWDESSVGKIRPGNTLQQMAASPDWVAYILGRPMADEPGRRFQYNSGASHLLSAIVAKLAGVTTLAFAEENLFGPLGITDVYWPDDPQGVHLGGWGLQLIPRDMAKIGYLTLRGGQWQDEVIVDSAWIAESTANQTRVFNSDSMRFKLWKIITQVRGQELPAYVNMAYGYQWWLPAAGGFAALGYAGQSIFVLPEHDLVVVTTGGLPSNQAFLPEWLLAHYILPAVKPGGPLPAQAQPAAAITAAQVASRALSFSAITPPPSLAAEISGRTYQMTPNPSGVTSLTLTFDNPEEAHLLLRQTSGDMDVRIGMDNEFRYTETSPGHIVALRGGWYNLKTFAVESRALVTGARFEWGMVFARDQITLVSHEAGRGKPIKIRGRRT